MGGLSRRGAASRRGVVIALGAAAGLAVAVLAARSVLVVPTRAVADEVAGRVTADGGGRDQPGPLRAGAVVEAPTRLTTEQGARALLCWPDTSRVKIDPQTRVVLRRCHRNRLIPGQARALDLDAGRVWIRLNAGSDESSTWVKAGPAVVVARSGIFSVAAEPAGGAEVSVYDGRVKVMAGEATVALDRGKVAMLSSDTATPAVSAMTPRQLALWEQQDEIIGPYLRLSSPDNDAATRSPYARVSGRTEPGAVVTVNNETIPLQAGNRFQAHVALWEGANTIRVSARTHGQEAWQERTVSYRSPAASIEAGVVSSQPVEGAMTTTFRLAVKMPAGEPAAKGTPVSCSATTGEVTPRLRTSRDGVAIITFTYDPQGSPSVITCRSGRASCTIQASRLEGEQDSG